jgi:hypothetical protein
LRRKLFCAALFLIAALFLVSCAYPSELISGAGKAGEGNVAAARTTGASEVTAAGTPLPQTGPAAAAADAEPETEPEATEPEGAGNLSDVKGADVVTEPSATEPVTEPAVTEPVTEPAATESVTEPAVTEPVTEPAATEPVTKPAVAEPVTEPPQTDPVTSPEAVVISGFPKVIWRYGCLDETGSPYPEKIVFSLSSLPGREFSVSREEFSCGSEVYFGGPGCVEAIREIAVCNYTGKSIPEIVVATERTSGSAVISYYVIGLENAEPMISPVFESSAPEARLYLRGDGARLVVPAGVRKLYLVAAEKGSSEIPTIESAASYGRFYFYEDYKYIFRQEKGVSTVTSDPADTGEKIVLVFLPDSTGSGYSVSGRRRTSNLAENEMLVGLPVLEIPSEFKGLPVTEIAPDGFAFGAIGDRDLSLTKLVIPGSVRQIGGFSFTGWTMLEEVVLEDGVEVIGPEAFHKCTSLNKISLPGTLRVIGGRAFGFCAFSSFTVPETVVEIQAHVFNYCGKLTSVTLPSGMTEIPSGLFLGCAKLESVTIPAGVTSIGSCAFWGCTSLRSLIFASGEPLPVSAIGIDAFRGCHEEAYPHEHEFVIYREDKGDICQCRICAEPGIPDDSYFVYD